MTTGTARNKNQQIRPSAVLFIRISFIAIPGGVTNTSGTSLVPAALVSVALYVPVVAELAVMVRVKLKVIVPAGALEQGLPMM